MFNKLKECLRKIPRYLGEVVGWLLVISLTLGLIIVLVKEIHWIIGLFWR